MTSSKGEVTLLEWAIKLALEAHEGQKDKVGRPYILHPLSVMFDSSLTTDEERVVAVLHDVLEDTDMPESYFEYIGMTPSQIHSIKCLTHGKGEPNIEYWERVLSDPTGVAKKVKIADIKHNTSPERMEGLPLEDALRMTEKYKKALQVLCNR